MSKCLPVCAHIMHIVILIQLTCIARGEVWRQSQSVITRLVVYREPTVFGMGCLPVVCLHINPENIATITGQRVDVVKSQPELAADTTEAVLVVGPIAEEVNRTVQTSLEDLMYAPYKQEWTFYREALQITAVSKVVICRTLVPQANFTMSPYTALTHWMISPESCTNIMIIFSVSLFIIAHLHIPYLGTML